MKLRFLLMVPPVLLAAIAVAAEFVTPQWQPVPYRIGAWEVFGKGAHRAVVAVDAAAPAVRVELPWRRRDRKPETKAVLVYAPGDAVRVANVAIPAFSPDCATVVFEAKEPGEYFIYYLPYAQDWKYLPAEAAAWQPSAGPLPQARLVAFEAVSEIDSFYPMEVPATAAEVDRLREKVTPERPYLIFPEDRSRSVRMSDRLPLEWLINGPANSFRGQAQPGEIYPLQLAVWAAGDLRNLDLRYTPLADGNGNVIATETMSCLNLDIVDPWGRYRHQSAMVADGKVQVLWILLQLPLHTPEGTYRGTFTVSADGVAATPVDITLEVAGEALPDGGVRDNWRLSRLAWLNSTAGINDEVLPPYTPFEVKDSTVKFLNRELELTAAGLPEAIRVKGRNLLQAPASFEFLTPGGPLVFDDFTRRILREGKDNLDIETTASGNEADYRLALHGEADGYFEYELALTAKQDLELNDFQLRLPLRESVARYILGLGIRGGYRTGDVRYKWDPNRCNNMVWLGDAQGGMQLRLKPDSELFHSYFAEVSPEWDNRGAGGIDVTEAGNTVSVTAYSGKHTLKRGDTIRFRFMLLVTPFHDQDPERWDWRTNGWGMENGNTEIIFHATRGNRNINYPFSELADLAEEIDKINHTRLYGSLELALGERVSRASGALGAAVRLDFDTAAESGDLLQLALPLEWGGAWAGMLTDRAAIRWDAGTQSLQWCYLLPDKAVATEITVPGLNWRRGETHRVGFGWSDGKMRLYADGRSVGEIAFEFPSYITRDNLNDRGRLTFRGPVALKQAASSPDNRDLTMTAGEAFALTEAALRRYDLTSGTRLNDGAVTFDTGKNQQATLYYSGAETSVFCPEIWAMRSLAGNELFEETSFVFSADGAKIVSDPEADALPWLREHIITNYAPSWRTMTSNGEMDMAIALKAPSRWHNFHAAGAEFIARNYRINGIYFDCFSVGRQPTKRLRKVLYANNPDSAHLWWHGGNNYDYLNLRSSIWSSQQDAIPFYSHAWTGEVVDFSRSLDYYMMEISGVPFGIASEMLDYRDGGNAYRAMIFGMTGRSSPTAPYMYRLWDDFDIGNAAMYGYWGDAAPVKSTNENVIVTTYVHFGEAALVALANWEPEVRQNIRHARIRPLDAAPVIDGIPDDPVWQQQAALKHMFNLSNQEIVTGKLTASVAFDAEKLYLAFTVEKAPELELKSVQEQRDGAVWQTDDAVEFFIQPDLNRTDFYHFSGNSRGVIFDAKTQDATWNGNWEYAAKVGDDHWSGEVAIPLTELGLAGKLEQEGFRFGFNVCNTRQTPIRVNYSWGPATVIFHDGLGRLEVARNAPASQDEIPRDTQTFTQLQIDYEALGLKPDEVELIRPNIRYFQSYQAGLDPAGEIGMRTDNGVVLLLKKK